MNAYYFYAIGLAVIFLYVKWMIVILSIPFFSLEKYYRKGSRLNKLLHIPYALDDRIFHRGFLRWCLFQVSVIPSKHLRKWIYKIYGVNVGRNVVIHFNTEIREPTNLSIGDGSIIGDSCILDARNFLKIGRNVNFSSNVSIYTAQHDHRSPSFSCYNPLLRKQSVEIEDRVWVGSNVVILPGVVIGEGAVCCAGSVVSKDVEPFSIVAGVPARKISERTRNLVYEFKGNSTRLY